MGPRVRMDECRKCCPPSGIRFPNGPGRNKSLNRLWHPDLHPSMNVQEESVSIPQPICSVWKRSEFLKHFRGSNHNPLVVKPNEARISVNK